MPALHQGTSCVNGKMAEPSAAITGPQGKTRAQFCLLIMHQWVVYKLYSSDLAAVSVNSGKGRNAFIRNVSSSFFLNITIYFQITYPVVKYFCIKFNLLTFFLANWTSNCKWNLRLFRSRRNLCPQQPQKSMSKVSPTHKRFLDIILKLFQ